MFNSGHREIPRSSRFLKKRGLLLFLEERQILAVAFFFQLFHRNKPQSGRVDAEALSSGRWSFVKYVAEMRIALAGTDLGALHAKATVGFFRDVLFLDRLGEAGPAPAAVKFVAGNKARAPRQQSQTI